MTARARRAPRAQILAFATALQVAAAVALPAMYRHLFHLAEAQAQVVRVTFWALVPVVTGMVALTSAFGLRVGKRANTAAARRRVLQLPVRLALVVLATEAAGVVALLIGLRLSQAPLPVAVGLGLCTAALGALPPVPLYAFARVTLLPLALNLGDGQMPTGRRVGIGLQLGYCVVAVTWAALVPAAVFGAAQLDVAAEAAARARAQVTGLRLQQAAAELDVAAATTLVTHTPLQGGERTLLRAASGTLLPDDAAPELDDLPYVELPLAGALRGGTLRVYYVARPLARGPLLAITFALLVLALVLAIVLGSAVGRDLRGIALQLDRIAREEEPRPLGTVATAEVRRLARAVNRLLERIPRFQIESFLAIERTQEAQRLKSQFLANMSHDLRSPLNSILGFSELLLRGIEGPITDGQRAHLEVMQERGNHLLRLLNEILDTAKVESGKMELHRQPSPPAELIRAALQEAQRGRKQPITDRVQITLQPGLRPIHVDPLRVTQALTHLLNWALEAPLPHSEGGARGGDEVPPTIFLSVSEARFELEHPVALGDTEAAQLFDGFRRSGMAGLHLALPLCRRLAELHGGTLTLEERSPTRLRLTLPEPQAGTLGGDRTKATARLKV